jgi:phage gpG-like protein
VAEYFDVQVDASEIVELIEYYEERGGNLEPVMAVIAEDLVGEVNDMYESEGRGQWPPHAASTLRKRRGGGRGARLMQDTGVLAASTEPNYGSDFAEATTGVEYIVYHLDGGPVIPQRNPFDLEEDVFDAAVDTLLEYVVE